MTEKVASDPCNSCLAGFHQQCADWPGRIRCPCSCAKCDDLEIPKYKWAPLRSKTVDGERDE